MTMPNRTRTKTAATTPTKCRRSSINSLPTHVKVEVLARVASSSLTDLFNAKLWFSVTPWCHQHDHDNKEISFLKHCMECGNPEALFRQGMVDYFSRTKAETGLQQLKRAAEKGHAEASYVYGIILLCTQGKSNREGLERLNFVKSSKPKELKNIRELRERVKEIIRQMWIHNSIDSGAQVEGRNPCCQTQGMCRQAKMGWPLDEDENDEVVMGCCGLCSWDREVASFCDMLYGRPSYY